MATSVDSERRLALVVGNSKYKRAGTLRNPANDAADVADSLEKYRFDVIGGRKNGINLTCYNFSKRVEEFANRLNDCKPNVALFYYAGHAIQIGDCNFLVPVDAQLRTRVDLTFQLIQLDRILSFMESDTMTSLVILDSCRNNPFSSDSARIGSDWRAVSMGSAGLTTPKDYGLFIAFAASPGKVAYDGEERNGYFTGAILEELNIDPTREIDSLLRAVKEKVVLRTQNKSNGPQRPWTGGNMFNLFRFEPSKHLALDPSNYSLSSMIAADAAIDIPETDAKIDVPMNRSIQRNLRSYLRIIVSAFELFVIITIIIAAFIVMDVRYFNRLGIYLIRPIQVGTAITEKDIELRPYYFSYIDHRRLNDLLRFKNFSSLLNVYTGVDNDGPYFIDDVIGRCLVDSLPVGRKLSFTDISC